MFLKGKNTDGAQTLVAVSQIASITESQGKATVVLTTGDEVTLDLGMQAIGNRLKELDVAIA